MFEGVATCGNEQIGLKFYKRALRIKGIYTVLQAKLNHCSNTHLLCIVGPWGRGCMYSSCMYCTYYLIASICKLLTLNNLHVLFPYIPKQRQITLNIVS